MKIRLFSPRSKIQYIQLLWHINLPPGMRILNDHWERGYGDLEWRGIVPDRSLPWYFLAFDGKRTFGAGVKTNPAALCSWRINHTHLELLCDVRSGCEGVQLGQRELDVVTIVSKKSCESESPFQFAKKFCRSLCSAPILPKEPIYGFNDWYYAYGSSTRDTILRDTEMLATLAPDSVHRPFSVIDSGWQLGGDCCGGPWDRGNKLFGDMKKIADEIKASGIRPGIWIRPLRSNERLPEKWICGRDESGWLLDPSVPDVLAYIAQGVKNIAQEWEYELIKHDFSSFDMFGMWGFAMGAAINSKNMISFDDKTRTSAEIIQKLYQAIQEAANDAIIIGCNTFSHLAAGYVHIQRIGDDTSGKDWARTRKMGVNSLSFRLPQHNAFYAADADCVGLTSQVPWTLNRQWLELLAKSGTPLFISASPDALHDEQKNAIKEAFTTALQPVSNVEPLDWMDTTIPQKWRFGEEDVYFNWFDEKE